MPAAWPTEADLVQFFRGAGLNACDGGALSFVPIAEIVAAAVEWWENATHWWPFLAAPTAVQWVALTGNPTGGTFKLNYGDTATATLSAFAPAAAVQAALRTAGAAGALVTGADGGPWTVSLDSDAADLRFVTAGTNALTGGASPAIIAGEPPQMHTVFGPEYLPLRSSYAEVAAVYEGDSYLQPALWEPVTWQGRASGPILSLRARSYAWYVRATATNIVGRQGFAVTVPPAAWLAVLKHAAGEVLPLLGAQTIDGVAGGVIEWRKGDVTEKYGTSGRYGGLMDSWRAQCQTAVASFLRTRSA